MIIKIPENEFTADVEQNFLFNLIEESIQKADGTGNLSKILIKEYSLKKYTERGLADNLRKWQKKRHLLYLSAYIKFGDYMRIDKKTLFSKIVSIKLSRGKLSLKTSYPIELNGAWAFLSECIRTEGHLTKLKKRVILENTDVDLIEEFKKNVKKIGITKFKQDLKIKFMVPLEAKLSEVKVLNLNTGEEKKLHRRILRLKNYDRQDMIFTEPNVSIGGSFTYLVMLKSSRFNISVHIPKSGKIKANSTLKTEIICHKVTPSLIVGIGNSTFYYILSKTFKIQSGEKSRQIFIPNVIKQLPKNTLKHAVNSVLAAESTIVPQRGIAIISLSKQYIRDLREIFLKFNITCKIDKKQRTLFIFGSRNVDKLKKNFDFILKSKNDSLKYIIKSRKEIHAPNGLSKSLYLKSLDELGIATSIEIINRAGRSGNSFRFYIKNLLDKDYIKVVKNIRPKTYMITTDGKIYLKNNKTYWAD